MFGSLSGIREAGNIYFCGTYLLLFMRNSMLKDSVWLSLRMTLITTFDLFDSFTAFLVFGSQLNRSHYTTGLKKIAIVELLKIFGKIKSLLFWVCFFFILAMGFTITDIFSIISVSL